MIVSCSLVGAQCYVVFDILWADGVPKHPELNGDLTGHTLIRRKEVRLSRSSGAAVDQGL